MDQYTFSLCTKSIFIFLRTWPRSPNKHVSFGLFFVYIVSLVPGKLLTLLLKCMDSTGRLYRMVTAVKHRIQELKTGTVL